MAVYENVIVNATEARDAAAQIDTAIKNMQDGIDKLNQEMGLLHQNTETAWETKFHEDWNNFYRNKVPTVINALKGQAENLRTAATAAEHLNV